MGHEAPDAPDAATDSDEGLAPLWQSDTLYGKQSGLDKRTTSEDGTAGPRLPSPANQRGGATSTTDGLGPQTFQGEAGWNPWLFHNPMMFGGTPDVGGFAGGVRPNGFPPLWFLGQNPFPLFFPFAQPPHEHGGQFGSLVAVIPLYGPTSMPPSNVVPMMLTVPMGAPVMTEGFLPATVAGGVMPGDHLGERAGQGEAREQGVLRGLGQAIPPPWGGLAQRGPLEPPLQAIRSKCRGGFQLDLLLLLKLAVVVFVFNQDGSKDRLFLLLFLAAVVYMYQTGALTPLLLWFSQSAQQAMMPPQQLNPAVPNAEPQGAGRGAGADEHGQGAANANPARGPQRFPPDGANWWGIVKELQMLVVGFLTSLLPGFQHAD